MRAVIVFIIAALLVGCAPSSNLAEIEKTEEKLVPPLEEAIQTTEDGTKYLVHPSKIRSGGPGRGTIGKTGIQARGIPALSAKNIKFVSTDEADKWIEDNELVLALIYNGVKRVYPLQIMVWHEIINDKIEDDPLLITYCPLCGSGIAYEPFIDLDGKRQATQFGTTGNLYNSNLVMYDQETDTYWQQIDGKAIIGQLVGQELQEVSIDTVVWRDWKKTHPDSQVLSQDTGHKRPYGEDPYGSYYEDSFLMFPVENQDDRIHPKTIIFGVEVEGSFQAYREDDLKKVGAINDIVGGVAVKVQRDEAGLVKITREDSGEEVVKERDMWFAWYAFHPETTLYEAS